QSLTKHTFSLETITSVCDTCLRRQQQSYGCRLTERRLSSPHRIPLTGCTHMSDVRCGLVGCVRHCAYARCKRSSILYSPRGCCITHFAARSAPLAKVSRLCDRCTSSRRSPGPPKSTVCSPTISPARTTWIPTSVSDRRPIIPRRP